MAYGPFYFSVYGIRENCLWHITFSDADNIWHIKNLLFFLWHIGLFIFLFMAYEVPLYRAPSVSSLKEKELVLNRMESERSGSGMLV